MSDIGRALGRDRSSIHYVARCYGGFVPTIRRRSRLALRLVEREDISRGIAVGWSIRRIAEGLSRSASTVSREVSRHGGGCDYRATEADVPAEVEDRAIPGHWEGDLISGSKNSHIVTLVERQSRFTALIKVPSRDTDTVVSALTRHVRKLPTSLRRSLTWDRGKEMAKHQTFTVATDVKVYFCDPQSLQ